MDLKTNFSKFEPSPTYRFTTSQFIFPLERLFHLEVLPGLPTTAQLKFLGSAYQKNTDQTPLTRNFWVEVNFGSPVILGQKI